MPSETAHSPSAVVARRVREHRELHGLTQSALVGRLEADYGWRVDRSVIARIESGDRIVSVDELFLLAAALETSPTLLLTPADEAETMAPTGRRPMTSNRVRAWISDEVRLWEQSHEGHLASSKAAWWRSLAQDRELIELAERLAALHGVDSIEDVDPSHKLAPKAEADAQLLALRIALAGQRAQWEVAVGPWAFTEIDEAIDLLAHDPPATAAAAKKLWKHRALDEMTARNAELTEQPSASAEEARARAEGLVQGLRGVVFELVKGTRPVSRPAKTPAVERAKRPAKQGPA